jgi:hypothetical protein
MSIFTAEELDQHIAAVKAALLANPKTAEYTIDIGGSRRSTKYNTTAELRDHLIWLQSEKTRITGTAVGRTYAKTVGRY